MRRTKIVCTLGPASDSPETIEALIKAGMNVARLNFSHGNHEEHGARIELVRSISEELRCPVAILQDLGGPKIRIGMIQKDEIRLQPKDQFTLTTKRVVGDERQVSVTYAGLPHDVEEGDAILLSDGRIELKVIGKMDDRIDTEVVVGGVLSSGKGINLPAGRIKATALTDKDKKDLKFGIQNDVDYVALSFVRTAEDVQLVKDAIGEKGSGIPVIAKIERHEALKNIDEIIGAADGIMVARGDLGVEIPVEKIALTQKMLIRKSNAAGKVVITATQMLQSMKHSPRPTRAEATDVANAILDGTDAVMLSDETAMGDYPVKSVQMMAKIAEDAELAVEFHAHRPDVADQPKSIPDAVSHASCTTARDLNAAAIVTCTDSGSTARLVAKYRPRHPIVATTPNLRTYRQLALVWGVIPVRADVMRSYEEIIGKSIESARDTKLASTGDCIVMTAGIPIGVAGSTNLIRVVVLE